MKLNKPRSQGQALIEGWAIQALIHLSNGQRMSVDSVERDSAGQLAVPEAWQEIWNILLKQLPFFSPSVMEKALLLLDAIICGDLIDNQLAASSQEKIWKLGIFDDSARLSKYVSTSRTHIFSSLLQFVVSYLKKFELQVLKKKSFVHRNVGGSSV